MATTLSNMVVLCKLAALMSKTEQGETISVNNDQAAFSVSLTAGTSANQADLLYTEIDRAVTSGNNDDIDLFDLAGMDATADLLGNTVSFVEIVALAIQNESGSAGNAVIGGEGSAAAWNSMFSASDTATITIHPGGFFMCVAPDDPAYAVADTSNHLLRVNASGGNITYNLGILGRSA